MEGVYREILNEKMSGKTFFYQKELAERLGLSISTVHHALKPLERMGAIIKRTKGFSLASPKKTLYYWASIHTNAPAYQTFYDASVEEIEGLMPPVLFTAYSGAKLYNDIFPAEYSEVLIYAPVESVKKRFPPSKRRVPNIIVLRCDDNLFKFNRTPLCQIFVDLWNLNTWYAQEFLKVLEERFDGILE